MSHTKVTASFDVTRGVTQNHVRETRVADGRVRVKPTARYWVRDMSVRGRGYKVICISMPPDVLARMDALCARIKMSRSELIRRAFEAIEVAE